MKILFAGTPQFAVPSLRSLVKLCRETELELCAVLTAPARPSGRGRKLLMSPVALEAQKHDIPVLDPERLGSNAREQITAFQPDLLVCVAYGRIFGPKMMHLFQMGGINLHPSLLPAHRGPAPIPAAILNGDAETGLSVQKLALEMDAGDILVQEKRPLDGSETSAELTEWASARGAELLVETIQQIVGGTEQAVPQNHEEASYCSLLKKEDGEIDWARPADEIDRQIRAYNPYPGAFSTLNEQKLTIWDSSGVQPQPSGAHRSGTILKIDRDVGILIQTGKDALGITRLQLAHRKSLDHRTFCNGFDDLCGSILGENV